jgi:hypothetical protein
MTTMNRAVTYLAIVDVSSGYALDVYPEERDLRMMGNTVVGEFASAEEAHAAVREIIQAKLQRGTMCQSTGCRVRQGKTTLGCGAHYG